MLPLLFAVSQTKKVNPADSRAVKNQLNLSPHNSQPMFVMTLTSFVGQGSISAALTDDFLSSL
jgi:hypothetical protein